MPADKPEKRAYEKVYGDELARLLALRDTARRANQRTPAVAFRLRADVCAWLDALAMDLMEAFPGRRVSRGTLVKLAVEAYLCEGGKNAIKVKVRARMRGA